MFRQAGRTGGPYASHKIQPLPQSPSPERIQVWSAPHGVARVRGERGLEVEVCGVCTAFCSWVAEIARGVQALGQLHGVVGAQVQRRRRHLAPTDQSPASVESGFGNGPGALFSALPLPLASPYHPRHEKMQ